MSSLKQGKIPTFCMDVIEYYGAGAKPYSICKKFSISEYSFYMLLKRFPKERDLARKKRKELSKKNKINTQQSEKVISALSSKHKTPEEKNIILEEKLRRLTKKNDELEKLLFFAEECLGKKIGLPNEE